MKLSSKLPKRNGLHAEHLHREQLIMRVQDAIKPHLHLTLNQVRLVLDAIEAA